MAITDYRLNPFSGALNLKSISGEVHTIPSNSPYEIRLNEVPYKGSPSTLKISFQSGGSLTEVSAQPAAGQFWPDYSATAAGIDGWNTGRILFNAADAGKTVVCSYQGMGTLADSRLAEQLEMTFTASKQGNRSISLSSWIERDSDNADADGKDANHNETNYGNSHTTTYVRLYTDTGLRAGTYTLQQVLQYLVDKSHTHKQKTWTRTYECSTCDCACCFIAGTLVTMADGSTKPIEAVKPGDKVLGMGMKVNTVHGIHHVLLGSRRAMMTFPDRSITFTGDHIFRIRTGEGIGWGVVDIAGFIREHENIIDLSDFYGISGEPDYYRFGKWEKKTPIIAREYGDNTECYDLILDGDSTYHANGYLVKAFTEDY